jgi:hypothetical protein
MGPIGAAHEDRHVHGLCLLAVAVAAPMGNECCAAPMSLHCWSAVAVAVAESGEAAKAVVFGPKNQKQLHRFDYFLSKVWAEKPLCQPEVLNECSLQQNVCESVSK